MIVESFNLIRINKIIKSFKIAGNLKFMLHIIKIYFIIILKGISNSLDRSEDFMINKKLKIKMKFNKNL